MHGLILVLGYTPLNILLWKRIKSFLLCSHSATHLSSSNQITAIPSFFLWILWLMKNGLTSCQMALYQDQSKELNKDCGGLEGCSWILLHKSPESPRYLHPMYRGGGGGNEKAAMNVLDDHGNDKQIIISLLSFLSDTILQRKKNATLLKCTSSRWPRHFEDSYKQIQVA